jgi:hypothetical protein
VNVREVLLKRVAVAAHRVLRSHVSREVSSWAPPQRFNGLEDCWWGRGTPPPQLGSHARFRISSEPDLQRSVCMSRRMRVSTIARVTATT